MRDSKVVEAVQPVFESDGIWLDVDQSESMFLLVPHMFAHIVLKDAAKYERAMEALRRIHIQSKAQHERFEWRLRSIWKINRAEYIGPYYNDDGTMRTASAIYVELSSESRVVSLRVAFTFQAGDDLARAMGSAPNDYEAHKRGQVEKTRKYIELLLDAGGEMAWDPLWPAANQLVINSDALAWILQEEKRRVAS
jgi:hypothetical protein